MRTKLKLCPRGGTHKVDSKKTDKPTLNSRNLVMHSYRNDEMKEASGIA